MIFANNDLPGSLLCVATAVTVFLGGAPVISLVDTSCKRVVAYCSGADTLLEQARNYQGKDEFEKASSLYQQYLRYVPNNPDAAVDLSYCQNSLEEYDAAFKSAQTAIAIDPRIVGAHSNKAWALNHLERYSEALNSAEQGLAIDKGDGESWCAKGEALYNLGRYDEALIAINEHNRIHSTESYGFYIRSYVYEELGKTDLAERDRKRAEKLDE